jgi:hypothetical protein
MAIMIAEFPVSRFLAPAVEFERYGKVFTNGAKRSWWTIALTTPVESKKNMLASVRLGVLQECLIRGSLLQQLLLELSFRDYAFLDEELG